LISRQARFDRRICGQFEIEHLAGTDEAGRGCLAGPVVAAAVILPVGLHLEGVRDSKQMSLKAREEAFSRIRREAVAWNAIAVDAGTIDRLNILHASLQGMDRAVARLRVRPQTVLVDGNKLPPDLVTHGRSMVKGDDRSQCIAAASIVAKVVRDRLMRAWHRHYPGYGFDQHVGYPTPEHKRALERLGPCPLHRNSFAPVAAAAAQTRLPFASRAQTS
jgi:ribonuclease HII